MGFMRSLHRKKHKFAFLFYNNSNNGLGFVNA